MQIGVHKVAMAAPNDVSELAKLIDSGVVKPSEIVALDAPNRVTISVWESMDAFNKWYNGAEYQAALKIGEKYAKFRRYAIEGTGN